VSVLDKIIMHPAGGGYRCLASNMACIARSHLTVYIYAESADNWRGSRLTLNETRGAIMQANNE
jgi:hypothetical protein